MAADVNGLHRQGLYWGPRLQRWRRSRVVTFTAITLRGPRFKPRPGQKFDKENLCYRRTPAVVKACHPCRVRPIKTPLYKTNFNPCRFGVRIVLLYHHASRKRRLKGGVRGSLVATSAPLDATARSSTPARAEICVEFSAPCAPLIRL